MFYMEGFILAAGLGTRLRPLTDDRPKALVEVGGMTLLERTIRRMEDAGIRHIVINVHHFADKVIDFVREGRWQAAIDISDERSLLLDTGGGLRFASRWFSGEGNVLVHNVDILSDVDFSDVEQHHRETGNLVTLCVSQRKTKRLLRFDEEGHLSGRTDADDPAGLAFSGISMVSSRLFPLLPEADHPYPVIDEYIRLTHEGHRIGSYVHPAEHWLDVGKPETLELANNLYNH